MPASAAQPRRNLWRARDVESILRERGWRSPNAPLAPESEAAAWIARAAELLGPHAPDRESMGNLLALCFEYDAQKILISPSSHVVLAREGAREVIRALALELLSDPVPMDSDRFHALVESLKVKTTYRGRGLFHPIRLVLAGRVGEGELDRVILLLDSAASLREFAPVKSTRARMLEFCAALE